VQKKPLLVGAAVASFAAAAALGGWWVLRPSPGASTGTSTGTDSGAAAPQSPSAPREVVEEPLVAASNSGFVVAHEAPKRPASETAIMTALRASQDPATRLALARDGNQRFPAGPGASERTAAIVAALVALDRVPEARVEARQFLEAHPSDPWAKSIESLTGVHAIPSGPPKSP